MTHSRHGKAIAVLGLTASLAVVASTAAASVASTSDQGQTAQAPKKHAPPPIRQTSGAAINLDPGSTDVKEVSCRDSENVVGGGWDTSNPNVIVVPTESKLLDAQTWRFTFFNNEPTRQRLTVYAICAG